MEHPQKVLTLLLDLAEGEEGTLALTKVARTKAFKALLAALTSMEAEEPKPLRGFSALQGCPKTWAWG